MAPGHSELFFFASFDSAVIFAGSPRGCDGYVLATIFHEADTFDKRRTEGFITSGVETITYILP
jgi:hypothetical protein